MTKTLTLRLKILDSFISYSLYGKHCLLEQFHIIYKHWGNNLKIEMFFQFTRSGKQ